MLGTAALGSAGVWRGGAAAGGCVLEIVRSAVRLDTILLALAAFSAADHDAGRHTTCSCIAPITSRNSCVRGVPEASASSSRRSASNVSAVTAWVCKSSSFVDFWRTMAWAS